MNDQEKAQACANAFRPLVEPPKVPPWRKTVVTNVEIRCDLERADDREAMELLEILRDHRQLDRYRFRIHRERETLCVHCKSTPDEDVNGYPWCCGKAQAEADALGLKQAD